MKATGYSTWHGTWKEGSGTVSTGSDTIKDKPYSFSSRFEGTPGASPEELLATAQAGCFNQALANNFGMIGFKADSINTNVVVDLGYGDDGHPAIKSSFITTEAKCPGIAQAQFDHCVERARTTCTIALILKLNLGIAATLLP
ncbi:OsmC family peroxiredoxin [Paraburkholderia sp. BL25I1N1]|uniref:OsmC family peroxiredoxin n=1 Tax=Paraburkholderia sp. BL25I1N1 TaxID=1938804 RepID=UPI000D049BFA|nr:OsmC family peroxiredoxin [Paraburkholderia sp. BL25I1N1]PRY04439.1 osmotically inducible protein OsmC [Paraburkholderia sp. BL25I1N1]